MSSELKVENEFLHNCVSDTSVLFDKSIKLVKKGKVRDIYNKEEFDSIYYLSASDRLSAFDRHLTTIPFKGTVLNKITVWWFNKTNHIIPNHLLSIYNERTIKVKKCNVFPIEFVVRAYLTGTTDTSIWKNYEKGVRNYCGHHLPDNMVKNQKLHRILLTPTTKDEHDELISKKEIIDKKIMTIKQFNQCEEYALKLFRIGQETVDKNGLILVDTKYEFGIDENNNICLVDELHTPDSSRYWIKKSYIERLLNKQEPDCIDKEFIRKWIKNTYEDPYDLNVEIIIPNEMRLDLSSKYVQLFELITGETF